MQYISNYLQSTKNIFIALGITAVALTTGISLAMAAEHSPADTDNDGFVSVIEGAPLYGGIAYSLTTDGATDAGSALALERFPVADKNGKYRYVRTFTLDESENDPTNFHVVVHGIDLNDSGAYDGDKPTSLPLPFFVPFEATVPAACGVVEMNGKSDTFRAKIGELNSTGAKGTMLVKKDGNEVTVKMNMKGVTPNIAHAQHFHAGGEGVCPPNTIGVAQEPTS